MNSKDIIQARIDELEVDLKSVVTEMKESQRPSGASVQANQASFERISKYKDQILGLRSAIAELKNIKELVC